jgi:hypothetical protein
MLSFSDSLMIMSSRRLLVEASCLAENCPSSGSEVRLDIV